MLQSFLSSSTIRCVLRIGNGNFINHFVQQRVYLLFVRIDDLTPNNNSSNTVSVNVRNSNSLFLEGQRIFNVRREKKIKRRRVGYLLEEFTGRTVRDLYTRPGICLF